MRTNEKVIKEISVGNVNIPISAKYIGDYEIDDIKDMIDQEVISGISDFSFYDETNATTVNFAIKSGQEGREGIYFNTVNLATGVTGETYSACGDITITAASTEKAGVMSAADKSKLDGIASGANKYTLPNATSQTLGGVKIGSNISVSSGTISLTKANVTSALGYTPPTTNTATTSSNGLMSNIDKMKFDQPFTGLVDGKGKTVTMTSSPNDPIVPINEYLNLSLRALPGVSVAFATYNSNAVVASPHLYKQAQRCALVLDKSQLSTIDYQTITWKTSAISGYGTPWSEQGGYSLIYIPSGYQSITFKHTGDYYNISAVGVHPTKYGGGYIFGGEWQYANESRTITLNNSDLYVILQAKKADNSDIDPKLDVLSELGISITLNRSDNNICRGFVSDDGTQVYPVFKSAQNNDFNRICYYTNLSGNAAKPQLGDILDCLAVYCHSLPYGYYKIIVQPPNNASEKYGVFDVLVSKDPSYSECKYLDVTAMINLNSVSDMSDLPFGHIWGQINTEVDMAGAYSLQSMYSNEWVYER